MRKINLIVLIIICFVFLNCNNKKQDINQRQAHKSIKINRKSKAVNILHNIKKYKSAIDFIRESQTDLPSTSQSLWNADDKVIIEAISKKRLIGAKQIGTTSLSFYFDLQGDIDAKFKPQTYKGARWRMEIAAYHIGKLIGINAIPPATLKRESFEKVKTLLEKRGDLESAKRLSEDAIDYAGVVKGAELYWVPKIIHSKVDTAEQYFESWARLLKTSTPLNSDEKILATQLSKLITFDYLIANWDRWSGGNVIFLGDRPEVLLFMDHNGAFVHPLSEKFQKRLDIMFNSVECFSKSLIQEIEKLSESKIISSFSSDPNLQDEEILTKEEISDVIGRRDIIVKRVEELSQKLGKNKVFYFE